MEELDRRRDLHAPGARVPAELGGEEEERGPDPLPAGAEDVVADGGDEGLGGFELGDHRPLDLLEPLADLLEGVEEGGGGHGRANLARRTHPVKGENP